MGEDESCKLCMDVGSLKHMLSGFITSLTQVHLETQYGLKIIAVFFFCYKQVEVSPLPFNDRDRIISFVRERQESGQQECAIITSQWAKCGILNCWLIL